MHNIGITLKLRSVIQELEDVRKPKLAFKVHHFSKYLSGLREGLNSPSCLIWSLFPSLCLPVWVPVCRESLGISAEWHQCERHLGNGKPVMSLNLRNWNNFLQEMPAFHCASCRVFSRNEAPQSVPTHQTQLPRIPAPPTACSQLAPGTIDEDRQCHEDAGDAGKLEWSCRETSPALEPFSH